MRIGELAARAGTTTRTLRYYEARGLPGPAGCRRWCRRPGTPRA
ncbi:MerR family DNA-binding transcriptional regulator, partial [Streptomyces sp. NPDC004262]